MNEVHRKTLGGGLQKVLTAQGKSTVRSGGCVGDVITHPDFKQIPQDKQSICCVCAM